MKQHVNKKIKKANGKIFHKYHKKPRNAKGKIICDKPKFGTSKLEQDFAKDFLDKLGINYQWQFEAKDICRFYDFYLPDSNILLEIDGDYWHSNPKMYDRDDKKTLTPTQKHDMRVDELKNKWAAMHSIPLYRIWEDDIRHKPEKVMEDLKKIVKIRSDKQILKENKNKRHNNKIK